MKSDKWRVISLAVSSSESFFSRASEREKKKLSLLSNGALCVCLYACARLWNFKRNRLNFHDEFPFWISVFCVRGRNFFFQFHPPLRSISLSPPPFLAITLYVFLSSPLAHTISSFTFFVATKTRRRKKEEKNRMVPKKKSKKKNGKLSLLIFSTWFFHRTTFQGLSHTHIHTIKRWVDGEKKSFSLFFFSEPRIFQFFFFRCSN